MKLIGPRYPFWINLLSFISIALIAIGFFVVLFSKFILSGLLTMAFGYLMVSVMGKIAFSHRINKIKEGADGNATITGVKNERI